MKTALALILAVCVAATAPAQTTTVINVRDFGALGDGSDQTTQINDAFAAANAAYRAFSNTLMGSGTNTATCPTVYFPSGSYAIHSPLVLPNKFVRLQGDQAVIQPTYGYPSGSPAISCAAPVRVRISGFIFFGFDIGIVLGSSTYDCDQGMNEITDCTFAGLRDTAIQYGHRSSILRVEECHFDYCEHVMAIWNCDSVQYRRCWAAHQAFGTANDSAFLIQGGSFRAEDSFFIMGGATTVAECAWFDVDPGATPDNSVCNLTIEGCRLSKENGGMTWVNWHSAEHTIYPVTPTGVILRDNIAEGGHGNDGKNDCLLRLFQCPNFISIRNNSGLINACTMQWSSTAASPASLVQADTVNAPLTVDVGGNCGGGDTNLGGGLSVNYVLPEFAGKANLR